MIRSLLGKAMMLIGAASAVLWMGWPTGPGSAPEPDGPDPIEAAPGPVVPPVGARNGADRPTRTAASARLDLNYASVEELEALPGVGAILARRIVEWRAVHGPFRTVEQLRDVKGIGRSRFERLRPLVTIGAAGGEPRSPVPPRTPLPRRSPEHP
ncbi:ComEA family DNA-binding protein [Nitrospira sp. Kam-Ns4a]